MKWVFLATLLIVAGCSTFAERAEAYKARAERSYQSGCVRRAREYSAAWVGATLIAGELEHQDEEDDWNLVLTEGEDESYLIVYTYPKFVCPLLWDEAVESFIFRIVAERNVSHTADRWKKHVELAARARVWSVYRSIAQDVSVLRGEHARGCPYCQFQFSRLVGGSLFVNGDATKK